MKCPQCQNYQKYKDGMTCAKCRYHFALDPKKQDTISDNAFKKALDRLSVSGQYYFTYDQLYARIYRVMQKKYHSLEWLVAIILSIFMGFFFTGGLFIMTNILYDFTGIKALEPGIWIGVIVVLGMLVFIWWMVTRPFKIPAEVPAQLIQDYKKFHPIKNLVDGTKFKHLKKRSIDEEFFKYAPERILIVQHNDMTDMLLMNRFHFENKTLVLSAQKYPYTAFEACARFLFQHPDIPIMILHDCSKQGFAMKEKIILDKSWNLEDKKVKNLGLNLEDVARLRSPIWIPTDMKQPVLTSNNAEENVENSYRMPICLPGPRSLTGAIHLAAFTGAALLSEELLAQQRVSESGRDSFGSSGFG